MAKQRKHLGEILYRNKLVDKEGLVKALKKAKAENKRLGEALVSLGMLTEDQIMQALAQQFGMEYVDLDKVQISASTMKLIPEELVKKHFVLPLGKEDGRLKIVIRDPLDLDMLDLLRFRLNAELQCCLASPTKIDNHIMHTMDEVRSSIDATAAELAAAGHAIEAEIRKAEAARPKTTARLSGWST